MTSPTEHVGFSSEDRHIVDENVIHLTSVGVDIGSSTSHLVFSKLDLELRGSRYVPVNRAILYESDILLTPYIDETAIDAEALEKFIQEQYASSGIKREDVDTGALILTGVALLRQNARAISELFAGEAGRFVAASAGHNLESTMAAHGSGAVGLSRRNRNTVLNVDIGGGTCKFAVCDQGDLREVAALNVGARLVTVDQLGAVVKLEAAGRTISKLLGIDLEVGQRVSNESLQKMASYMADRVMEFVSNQPLSAEAQALLLTNPLSRDRQIDAITFSGGVSEFIYGRQDASFGDMGPMFAEEIQSRLAKSGVQVLEPTQGIRATVIGASQYTVQVSGDTILVSPKDAVPVRNVPVISPLLELGTADIEPAKVKAAVEQAMQRLDLHQLETPVAVAVRWEGQARFARLDSLCKGILEALKDNLSGRNPVVLVTDSDVGGLLGIHLKEEMHISNPVISIDGVDLREFDYIDIGSLIPTSGAAPVVVKSLVFPNSAV
jgi:ethanolamine utilization protein EutA